MPGKLTSDTPKCIVRVDFLSHRDGQLRGDLEAVAFCEYVVGGPTAHNASKHSAAPVGGTAKGRGAEPVKMFACHELVDAPKKIRDEFTEQWLKCSPILGGQDRRRWTVQDAWRVHLMRRRLTAVNYRRSPQEARHYRIRFCPEAAAGHALAKADLMEEAARKFIANVEQDYGGRFWWIAGAHYNTDHPHVHIGIRGIDVDRNHVYFEQRYLRPTKQEIARDPLATSPIGWRARGVLAELLADRKGVRHAG